MTPCCPDLPPTRAATSRANDFAELCVSARAAGPVTASVRRSQWCSRGCTAPTAVHGRRAPPPWRAPGGISAAPAQLSRPSVHRPASGSLAFLPKGVESSGLHHDLHAALEHVCSRWP